MQAIERNPFVGAFADLLAATYSPERTQQMQGVARFMGAPAVASTLDKMSYGDSLVTGRGQTLQLKPDVAEAALAVAPFVSPAARLGGRALQAGARELAPQAGRMADQYMTRMGMQLNAAPPTNVLAARVGDQRSIDENALRAAFPDVEFDLSQKGNLAILNRVVVPKDLRGTGVGTNFMNELTSAADANAARLALSPSGDFGGNKTRLVDFYKRFGFVPNKGRDMDFTLNESMRREPQQQALEAAQKNALRVEQPMPAPTNALAPKKAASIETPAEYGGEHRPPGPDSGAPLHDLTGGGNVYPDDVYGANAAQYYGHGTPAMDRETVRILQGLKDKPNSTVTIYRAVPREAPPSEQAAVLQAQMKKFMARGTVPEGESAKGWYDRASDKLDRLKTMSDPTESMNTINSGDWVTVNRNYAKEHGEGALNGNYKIISQKVKANEVFTNGDSIHEAGYYKGGKAPK
jgi:predicted GNAT family N-acyltransferase